MKLIISGGGTGGHIYPALAIAEELSRKIPEAEILYVGTAGSMEEELSEKAGLRFKPIRVKGMPRKLDKRSLIAAWNLLLGVLDSKKVINEERPDMVIGTGGYVSGPISFVAGLSKIPLLIHEQNAFPGITNKLLSRLADKVLLTYPESAKYFRYPERTVVTGNPIRKDITGVDKIEAKKTLGIEASKPFVLSFGGSGGQRSLNDAILDILTSGLLGGDIQLLHVTGNRHHEGFIDKLKDTGFNDNKNVRIEPYFHQMPLALNAADIVITSGGAITLAEVSAVGAPSILIPKAYTAENHQEYNARAFESAGASTMILEKDLNGKILAEKLLMILRDREILERMANCSRSLGKPDASEKIVQEILEFLNI
ncbi:undecaprenyldiphospho-muramoylpentapeptide beta-N-acetylglucosaminyltransferase [Gudongella oleilytica]|jgi:UDP-N-acetylglucosamine--N-acetylmuramyl-(pentapeptide) pyrophosphoryl-undecaprenol N-acetylglucosamine transferase|uniref:undecaprenyldiphospho-muramoylpentapeptide beta-N-acetylglucosaminyltransferase n=1 Tax=Gudongella oleilytica TaxID=1582259 RepID=UPI000FF875E8|nr:undecaprenyldiphospho-muramoylpentapeptide beta-N-acetylglucosaminyltransferase [Gudongella oleilytica]